MCVVFLLILSSLFVAHHVLASLFQFSGITRFLLQFVSYIFIVFNWFCESTFVDVYNFSWDTLCFLFLSCLVLYSLGLPDIIERLIKDGKQMEAISFATEFELSDRFPPIPLLKSYLKDARKVVQNTQKSNHNAIAAQVR